ncbi:MAG: choice-of-anchor B family protein [Flavobacteriales bacterium]
MNNSVHPLLLVSAAFFISVSGKPQITDAKHVDLLDQWYSANMLPDGNTEWYNEVWGFVSNGKEYAIIGSQDGTHILEITNDNQLVERDFVMGASIGPYIVNRDFYVYGNYLYSICDQGFSTLQIMDVSYLPDSVHVVYDTNALVASAHTLWVDEAMKKLYVCGPAGYAMKIFDVTNPIDPQEVFVHTNNAYIHDCYVRNDTAFLNAGTEGLFVYKFTNLVTPQWIGVYDYYPDQGYNHSGKPNKNGSLYVFADETPGKRVKLVDITDLTDVQLVSFLHSGGDANTIAHDPVFFRDEYVMIAYYYDGLVIFDVKNPSQPIKVGWYDTYNGANSNYRGAWGVYADLPSERILVSDRQSGLYLLKFNPPPRINTALEHGVFPNPMNGSGYFWFNNRTDQVYDFFIYDSGGKLVFERKNYADYFIEINSTGLAPGAYIYHFRGVENETDVRGKFVVQKGE